MSFIGEATLRIVECNGIKLRIAEQGTGPLVLLIHGWPESWYSWRHQLTALAEAGYRAVAPDMRGYGGSDAPEDVEAYDVNHVTGDVVGLIDALGEETAIIVGHDWGALIVWYCAMLHAERFRGVAGLSVPNMQRPAAPPTQIWKKQHGDNFFYMLYFQDRGVAEAEFDADPRGVLSRLFISPDTPKAPPLVTDPKASAGGWKNRLGAPKELPHWLSAEDLDYYVAEFTRAGFRGGFEYYRNFDRNWELTSELTGARIEMPSLFICGAKDGVVRGASATDLERLMKPHMPDLRGVHVFDGAGHWIQQERATETNKVLVDFVQSIHA